MSYISILNSFLKVKKKKDERNVQCPEALGLWIIYLLRYSYIPSQYIYSEVRFWLKLTWSTSATFYENGPSE